VFVGGAAVSLLTALTGFLDWRDTERGTQVRRMANAHALTMVTVTLLVLANIGVRYFVEGAGRTTGLLLGLSIAIGALVVAGATIGGSLVYDYGFNVATAKDHPAYHPDAEAENLRRTG
jgi:uncharacterized membrane protein